MDSKDRFLEKAWATHGDRYDYSLVDYRGSKLHVLVVCRLHGPFPQTPTRHIQGQGCPVCAERPTQRVTPSPASEPKRRESGRPTGQQSRSRSRRKTSPARTSRNVRFIAAAKDRFGDQFDYSKVDYVDRKTPVTIGCRHHGAFQQVPNEHLRGRTGCPDCRKILLREKNAEAFLAKARRVHGDKYDYSNVVYIDSRTEVEIFCPLHGSFRQEPRTHVAGRVSGCPVCGHAESSRRRALTTKQFVQRAKAVHGNAYDYSATEYTNRRTKVEILCPRHGHFTQSPARHLEGSGCTPCGYENRTVRLISKSRGQI